jgi:hypothetical protein
MNKHAPKPDAHELSREQLQFWLGQAREIAAGHPREAAVAGLTRFAEELTDKLNAMKEQGPA